jgi:Predicted ATPase (AAA+ superfamily)
MRALIRLLAARSGQLLVATAVGSDAGLTASTVYRYLSLLEEVFLVKRIPAWSRNVSTRAVGTPKLAFTDSGIAANLLGADARSLLRPGGRFGPLLEGFVLMELARQLTWSRQRAECSTTAPRTRWRSTRSWRTAGARWSASRSRPPRPSARTTSAVCGTWPPDRRRLHRRRGAVHRHPDAAVRAQDARDADRCLVGNRAYGHAIPTR